MQATDRLRPYVPGFVVAQLLGAGKLDGLSFGYRVQEAGTNEALRELRVLDLVEDGQTWEEVAELAGADSAPALLRDLL